MEKIKQYFNSYKNSNTCFETSNGYLFHDLEKAKAHAATLANKSVKTWTREEVGSKQLAVGSEAIDNDKALKNKVLDVLIDVVKPIDNAQLTVDKTEEVGSE